MALTRLGLNQSINLASNVTGTLATGNGGTGSTATTFVNAASNVTGALPVANGGTALTSGFVNGGGLTVADMWQVTSGFVCTTGTNYFTAWSHSTTRGKGFLASQMAESSGVFTFPSTGIYLVQFMMATEAQSLTADNFQSRIHVTLNNSSYDAVAGGLFGQTSEGNSGMRSKTIHALVDVTDTSNVKVKFCYESASNVVYMHGEPNQNETSASFIRMGDT